MTKYASAGFMIRVQILAGVNKKRTQKVLPLTAVKEMAGVRHVVSIRAFMR